MAIRPVELQGVVQRSQDMSQIKQNQDIKPQTDQSNIQIQIQNKKEMVLILITRKRSKRKRKKRKKKVV